MTILVTRLHGEEENTLNPKEPKDDKTRDGYAVTGTEDLYQARAAVVAAVPAVNDDGLILDTVQLKHECADIWFATVNYVDPEKAKKEPDIGEIEIEIDGVGGTVLQTHGIAPTQIFHAADWNPMEFQRAIDVHRTKTGWQVKGTNVVVPKTELTLTTSFPPGTVTLEWYRTLRSMVGKTNDAVWKIWNKGELKFTGFRIKGKILLGTPFREKETVSFMFIDSPNVVAADNIMIGEGALAIGPIEMTGHQVPWVYSIQEDQAGFVLQRPVQCNVDTVCREADFTQIGLGA